MESHGKKHTARPVFGPVFAGIIKPYWGQLCFALFASLLGVISLLGIVQVMRILVDHVFTTGADVAKLHNAVFSFLLLAGGMALATYLRTFYFKMTAERAISALRQKLFNHLLTLDAPFFEKHRTGDLTSRLTADVTLVQQVLETSAPVGLRGVLQAVGGVVLMVYTNPLLAGVIVAVVVFIMLMAVLFGRIVRRFGKNVQTNVAEVNAYVTERVGGVRIVQTFYQEENTQKALGALLHQHLLLAEGYNKARGAFFAFATFSLFAAMAAVFWFGGIAVLEGRLSQGELSAVLLYSLISALGIGSLVEVITTLNHAKGAAERLVHLLAAQPEITQPKTPAQLAAPHQGRSLTFQNVTFTYPNKDDATLDGVSFHIPAGKMVAIVGPSGAGKSTLFQLVSRFFDPQEGLILLDGTPIKTLRLQDLRQNIGIVAQDVFLFAGTVVDNIRYGAPNATKAEVVKAAMLAHADDFIRALPQGYNTQIGERGVKLSGGQRQRLAIARALLVDPPLLLLDEATSHLDAASEQAVQKALEEVQYGRTTLAIAHRLATVQAADFILLMDEGKIIAHGTHKELLKQSPLYKKLATLQFLGA